VQVVSAIVVDAVAAAVEVGATLEDVEGQVATTGKAVTRVEARVVDVASKVALGGLAMVMVAAATGWETREAAAKAAAASMAASMVAVTAAGEKVVVARAGEEAAVVRMSAEPAGSTVAVDSAGKVGETLVAASEVGRRAEETLEVMAAQVAGTEVRVKVAAGRLAAA